MTTPARPAPPRPQPKPGQVKVFRSLYAYTAQQSDELTFDEGDLLYVTEMTNDGWWKGRCGNKSGLIPGNYVEESMESVDYPLHEAAKRGNLAFLQECIANKVSVNSLDKAGATPLYWAAHGGHIDCMRALLAIPNCQINAQNKIGDTALHAAAWKGHKEAVQILLENDARTDLPNKDGKIPQQLSSKDPATAALLIPQRTSFIGYDDDDEYLDDDSD
ncbi:osteoclast-stimulating factor 1-like isoform X1 [Lytechinus variegatus]|uniref:osteoclast-stimulating factor 1-like isoform X1 n=1 Tax=Lytechinus variegatus TaxID=7654 RepID=UPI001BB295AF|nr:osteoclast-stimulating factor 1-like isoform X1 [Lytechinus variegatus]XP_041465518.1 osteoclast-stimulating factor 1-like isoform X1 [Lytechinus variegatus]